MLQGRLDDQSGFGRHAKLPPPDEVFAERFAAGPKERHRGNGSVWRVL